MTESTKKVVPVYREMLLNEVRDYAHAQKEEWRRLPWLSLHANYPDTPYEYCHKMCYERGLWEIRLIAGHGTNFCTFIDCQTGDIVNSQLKPELEVNVLILSERFNALDALTIARKLEWQANQKPDTTRMSDDSIREWRTGIIERTGLAPLYTRKPARHAA